MRELEGRLERWVAAGVISPEQAARIGELEHAERHSRSSLAEVVGYVGAALAVGAIVLLLGDLWRDVAVAGRIVLVALLTVLLGGGGVGLRGVSSAGVRRLASVLFTGAVVGVGWLAQLVADEVLGVEFAQVALTVGLATLASALPMYLLRPRLLPQLTLLVTVALTVGALFAQSSLRPEPVWVGVTYWALGVAWLLLGAGGWLTPARGAELLGGLLALVAVQASSFGDVRLALLVLGLVTAGGLVGLAMVGDRVEHLAVGALGLFVLVPQIVFEIFGEVVGAAATLLIVGLLLVLLAVGIGRAGRSITAPPSATGARASDREPDAGAGDAR